MGFRGNKFHYRVSVLLINAFFFLFFDEQLKITNSNNTAWQDSKSNLLDKKRYQWTVTVSTGPAFASTYQFTWNQKSEFLSYVLFLFLELNERKKPMHRKEHGQILAQVQLEYISVPSSIRLISLSSTNSTKKKKNPKPMTVVVSETANQKNSQWSTTDINSYLWLVALPQLAFYFCSLWAVYGKHLQGFKYKEHLMLASVPLKAIGIRPMFKVKCTLGYNDEMWPKLPYWSDWISIWKVFN